MIMTCERQITVLLFIAALVMAGSAMTRMHRANVVLAQNAKDCATDAKLAELIRQMPTPLLENQP